MPYASLCTSEAGEKNRSLKSLLLHGYILFGLYFQASPLNTVI